MKNNSNRFRCTVVGCNPKLYGQESADGHNKETGHRTAKWPVRSAEGERKARIRNKTGYYDKYNVGAKSAVARGLVPDYAETVPVFVGGEYCGEETIHPWNMEDFDNDPGF